MHTRLPVYASTCKDDNRPLDATLSWNIMEHIAGAACNAPCPRGARTSSIHVYSRLGVVSAPPGRGFGPPQLSPYAMTKDALLQEFGFVGKPRIRAFQRIQNQVLAEDITTPIYDTLLLERKCCHCTRAQLWRLQTTSWRCADYPESTVRSA